MMGIQVAADGLTGWSLVQAQSQEPFEKSPWKQGDFFHFQRLLAFLATLHVYPSAEAVVRPAVHAYDECTGSIKQRKEVHHVHWRSFL